MQQKLRSAYNKVLEILKDMVSMQEARQRQEAEKHEGKKHKVHRSMKYA